MSFPAANRETIGYAERAAFYEVEYAGDPAERKRFGKLLTADVRSVLEIPCGAGDNTIALLRPGRRWVAVDREPAMVRRVAERTAGRAGSESLTALVGDMRSLRLGETFDLILVQREAFQMLARGEADRALAGLRAHLAPGGALSIDLATFDANTSASSLQPSYFDPGLRDGEPVYEWTRRTPSGAVLRRSRVQRRRAGEIEFEFRYEVRMPGGEHERWSATINLTTFSPSQLSRLIAGAGLTVVRADRDYRGSPHRPDAARAILLLKRA